MQPTFLSVEDIELKSAIVLSFFHLNVWFKKNFKTSSAESTFFMNLVILGKKKVVLLYFHCIVFLFHTDEKLS